MPNSPVTQTRRRTGAATRRSPSSWRCSPSRGCSRRPSFRSSTRPIAASKGNTPPHSPTASLRNASSAHSTPHTRRRCRTHPSSRKATAKQSARSMPPRSRTKSNTSTTRTPSPRSRHHPAKPAKAPATSMSSPADSALRARAWSTACATCRPTPTRCAGSWTARATRTGAANCKNSSRWRKPRTSVRRTRRVSSCAAS